jgi:antitoxin (DNA-binding transcriptional repressor) of toxin-antitoxin stability system
MAKNVIHVSQDEAATTFAALLERVAEGAEVVIENNARPVAILRAPAMEPGPGLLISESIALAKAHASTATLDGGFERDLNEIIDRNRETYTPPKWE